MKLTKVSLCAVLVLGGITASHATTYEIIKPTAATAVSTPGGGFQYQSIANIYNGSGLSFALNTGDPVPGTWATHTIAQTDAWVADYVVGGPLTWTVTLTLGGVYTDLTGFHLWNENEGEGGRSAKDYTVSYSTDNSLYTPTTASPTPFLVSTSSPTYTGADYSFASPVTAGFVKFVITTEYGGGYVGLSEIRFIEAIPEPSTFLLLGLGGLLVWRRTRKSYTAGSISQP